MSNLQNLKPFKKGQSGNPKGRPKGALSITNLIKKELKKFPTVRSKKTNAQLLIEKVLDKAIKKGDIQMLKTIWNYIDGMPKERKELSTKDGKPLRISIINEINKIYGNSDSKNDKDG